MHFALSRSISFVCIIMIGYSSFPVREIVKVLHVYDDSRSSSPYGVKWEVLKVDSESMMKKHIRCCRLLEICCCVSIASFDFVLHSGIWQWLSRQGLEQGVGFA